MTDSSMQSMFPQGKNEEGVPLTQAEREGGRWIAKYSVKYEVDFGGEGRGGHVSRCNK